MQELLSKISKEDQNLLKEGRKLPIMEHFQTIQGEGFYSGKAAYFIRIGGCDVGCHWCDVKESWNPNLHPLMDTDLVMDWTKNSHTIVITGGEPLIYNLDYLTSILKKENKQIHIETSGAYELSGNWDWITLSPKKRMLPKEEVYKKANELKVIVYNKDDFRFAEEEAKRVNEKCLLYLQPEWSKRNELHSQIVDYVIENPKWQISIQSHKFLGIP